VTSLSPRFGSVSSERRRQDATLSPLEPNAAPYAARAGHLYAGLFLVGGQHRLAVHVPLHDLELIDEEERLGGILRKCLQSILHRAHALRVRGGEGSLGRRIASET
jgi:hypothetical protein